MAKQGRSFKLADVDRTLATERDIAGWQDDLRAACYESISEADVREIVAKQVEKAKEGDRGAIQFVMGQLLGGNRPITMQQTNVITDVETAARIAKEKSA